MRNMKGQGRLFSKAVGGLETRLTIVNNDQNFGFLEEELASFTMPQNAPAVDNLFSAAQHLYDGIHDLERDEGLHPEIYSNLNTSEIAALFVADSLVKQFPDVAFVRGKSHNELLKEERAEEIISALVRIGYEYGAVRQMRHKGFTMHSTDYGELKERMKACSSEAQERFIQAFRRQRAVSSRENPQTYDFMDLNLAGSIYGYDTAQAAQVYLHLVEKNMKAVYERCTKPIR